MMAEDRTRRQPHGMDRRTFVKTSGSAAIALASGGLTTSFAAAPGSPPNILLIMTDQQHIDTIAAAGCPYVKTPALDGIKNGGVSFVRSYCANSVCSPSRAAILTGRSSSETGVWKNSEHIRFDILNMGEWFSQQGDYETVYAGKWHLPSGYSHFIPGFRVLHTGISGVGNVGDTAVSRACEGFLRNRSSSKPFLMVASLMQPHDICEWNRLNKYPTSQLPYQELADELPPLPDNFELNAAEPEEVRQRRQGWEPAEGKWDKQHWRYYLWSYYRHVEMVDGEVGRLLQALEETELDKNTLIVFTSDHGEGMAQHQLARKQTAYEASARVPLMVSWPGHVLENKTDATHLVTGMDIMPTVCEYAGIASPANMRGKSLKPLLEGKSVPWHSYIVMEIPSNAGRMVRTERYKYITYLDDPVEQLFDMQDDPGETVNLAASSQHASILDEHKKLLKEWEDQLDIAEGVPNPDAWRSS